MEYFQVKNEGFRNHKICNRSTDCSRLSLKSTICSPWRAGFTLFELIIVVFLISLMLALAIPSFTVLGESRIKSDAKRLASIARYLNDSAISTKETFSLKVDFKEDLIAYNGPDGKKSERFGSIYAVELQSRGVVSEGVIIIFFGPLGASEAFSFLLRDDEKIMTVAFNPLSGRVKIVMRNEKWEVRSEK